MAKGVSLFMIGAGICTAGIKYFIGWPKGWMSWVIPILLIVVGIIALRREV